MIVIANI
ncbi:hypothetical protein VCHENC02_5456A, partial [Vibrio harveyi]